MEFVWRRALPTEVIQGSISVFTGVRSTLPPRLFTSMWVLGVNRYRGIYLAIEKLSGREEGKVPERSPNWGTLGTKATTFLPLNPAKLRTLPHFFIFFRSRYKCISHDNPKSGFSSNKSPRFQISHGQSFFQEWMLYVQHIFLPFHFSIYIFIKLFSSGASVEHLLRRLTTFFMLKWIWYGRYQASHTTPVLYLSKP